MMVPLIPPRVRPAAPWAGAVRRHPGQTLSRATSLIMILNHRMGRLPGRVQLPKARITPGRVCKPRRIGYKRQYPSEAKRCPTERPTNRRPSARAASAARSAAGSPADARAATFMNALLVVWAACLALAIAWGSTQGHNTLLATGGRMGASVALVLAGCLGYRVSRSSPAGRFLALIALGMALGTLGDFYNADLLDPIAPFGPTDPWGHDFFRRRARGVYRGLPDGRQSRATCATRKARVTHGWPRGWPWPRSAGI